MADEKSGAADVQDQQAPRAERAVESGGVHLHLICKHRERLFEAEGEFITGDWAVGKTNLEKFKRVSLHKSQAEPAYLSGTVQAVLQGLESGRVMFLATKDAQTDDYVPKTWGQWQAHVTETGDSGVDG